MLAPQSDNLRDYLIAVLQCQGPNAAKDRLALRQRWKDSQRSGSNWNDSTHPQPDTETSTHRVEQWAGLEQFWAQVTELPSDVTQVLKPWLQSPWRDVQDAALQLQRVCQHRDQLLALWPSTVDRSAFDRFLGFLIRPESRRHSLQQSLVKDLKRSRQDRAFQTYLRRVQRQFPQFEIPDIIAQQRVSDPPVKLNVNPKPVVIPAEIQSNELPSAANFSWLGIAILIAVAKVFSTQPPKTTTPTFNFPPAGAARTTYPKDFTQQIKIPDNKVPPGSIPWLEPDAPRTPEQEKIYQSLRNLPDVSVDHFLQQQRKSNSPTTPPGNWSPQNSPAENNSAEQVPLDALQPANVRDGEPAP